MSFNADTYCAALQPPRFTAFGRTYTGRLLSVEEVARLSAKRTVVAELDAELKAAGGRGVSPRTTRQLQREAVVAWFPRPWWAWLLPVANPAWRAFRRLPEAAQAAALASFSVAQRRALEALTSGAPPLGDDAPTTTA